MKIFFRICSALVMDQYAWSREEAIRYLGITMATGGIVAGVCFTTVVPLTKRFDSRVVLLGAGIIPFIVAKLVILPIGNEYPQMYQNITHDDGKFIL